MDPDSSQSKFSLKLLVHKEEKRVIFGEADNNFVDTLFSIMTLPMATIVRLLRKHRNEKLKAIGCLNNLYQSLLDLSTDCMSAEENKWLLLNPITSSHDVCRKLKLNINDEEPTKRFMCPDFSCIRGCFLDTCLISTCDLARCRHCGKIMNREVEYEDSTVDGDSDDDVFVSTLTTFIVTDDLRVIPNSPGSSILLLCELGITDVSSLDNMSFDFGVDQILNLLEGALLSKNPLTWMVFPGSSCIQGLGVDREKPLVNHLTKNETARTLRTLKLKVTMQKSTSKLLFADGDCDLVEFIFGFLEIPLDNLFVTPLSSFSTITTLGMLEVPLNDIEVHEVSFGIEQGLELLDASLRSSEAFTGSILKRKNKTKN
ncbi:uncharacterized protein LOC143601192 [Bidens hawaiensis]|uniref:uncharacterized protein LOC143601192 n=1 Tax=Bidens hawaiensis TaxID=980011 RepID=UPI00404B6F73